MQASDLLTGSAALDDKGRAWLARARERVEAKGARELTLLFPALARTIGRRPVGAGIIEDGGEAIDFAAWRGCDAAGLALLQHANADDALIADLYAHGDLEERTITMRSLALLEIRPVTIQLLGEAQRTNTQSHFEACVCDSNLVARAVGHGGFTAEDAFRVLLKAAFVGLPLARFFGILEHAAPELTRMVTGLATEREAAGRAIWADTNRVICHAPIDGTRERLARGIEHGDAVQRLAAADALLVWPDAELIAVATAHLPHESSDRVRAALGRALASASEPGKT